MTITTLTSKNKSRPIISWLFIISGLIVPILIYVFASSPILTSAMADEIAYANFLASGNSSSDLWISTREFFPLSMRFFLKLFAGRDWMFMLRAASLCCYSLYSLSVLFLVFSLHTKKTIPYIISGIIAASIGCYGLLSLYACNYFISYVTAVFILVGLILNTFKLNATAKTKWIIAVASLVFVVVSIIMSLTVANNNNWKFKKPSSTVIVDIFSTPIFNTEKDVNTAECVSGLSKYLLGLDTSNIYTLSNITNIVVSVTNNAVTPAYIHSIQDLHPLNITDCDLSVYSSIENEQGITYIITDNTFTSEANDYLKAYTLEYQDDYYSVISYRNKELMLNTAFQNDIHAISNGSYDTYYISSVDISTYDLSELYRTRLWNAYAPETPCSSIPIFDALNTEIFSKSFSQYILEFDPYSLYIFLGKDIDAYRQCLVEHMETYVSANPEVYFYFIIPCYYIEHYSSYSSSDYDEMYMSYEILSDVFRSHTNVTYHYYGYYEYLYNNRYIYESGSDYLMVPEIANTLLLETLADSSHTFNADGLLFYIANFIEIAKSYPFSNPPIYDMSDTTIIVLGDSIFGLPLYQNDTAIQNIVGNYSGAEIICLAEGGATACNMYNNGIAGLYDQLNVVNLTQMINDLKKPNNKLLFLIEFGLNDYTLGYDVYNTTGSLDYSTYTGSLQSSVNTIKKIWPESNIVFITPGYINQKDYGEIPSTTSNHPLSEYRNAMINIADKNECGCVNLTEIGITPENCDVYLYGDAIHYNGIGRYHIAQYLLKYLSANY